MRGKNLSAVPDDQIIAELLRRQWPNGYVVLQREMIIGVRRYDPACYALQRIVKDENAEQGW